jgi:integrase/recombinase XerD
LLMARLGLRAPEVIAIQIDDIDWRTGEILIRGKGKLHDRMPLPSDVGEAIVEYIRNGRKGDSRALFVSAKTPHPCFKDAQILNTLLRDAFDRTHLKPQQKYVGSHLLRHSVRYRGSAELRRRPCWRAFLSSAHWTERRSPPWSE